MGVPVIGLPVTNLAAGKLGRAHRGFSGRKKHLIRPNQAKRRHRGTTRLRAEQGAYRTNIAKNLKNMTTRDISIATAVKNTTKSNLRNA